MNKLRFTELEVSKEVQKGIDELGFEEATQIQSSTIPLLLQGKDVIGQSQTGTGKTAAFGIPAIELINPADRCVQVLVLCPTRELAIQVAEDINLLGKYKKGLFCLPVYGGQSIDRQLKGLKQGAQLVVGTPGRIIDHINRGSLKLDALKMIVLDEADEMLNMGFIEDIELILSSAPEQRQTVMFSATMSKDVLKLTQKFQNNPERIQIEHATLTVADTEQFYFEVKERKKLEILTRLIDIHNLKLSIVFCNTKRRVDEVVEHLHARGYLAEGLHGDMKQSGREKVMGRFRKGDTEILVATDVAARGLDIENVEAVFNHDIPQDEEYYVHRIGRTGRAGKSGLAFSFVTGGELGKLKQIQRYINAKIKLLPVPSFDEAEEKRIGGYLQEIKNVLLEGGLEKQTAIIQQLLDEDFTSMEVAAALYKLKFPAETRQEEPAHEDEKEFYRDDFRGEGKGGRRDRHSRNRRNDERRDFKDRRNDSRQERTRDERSRDERPRQERSRNENREKGKRSEGSQFGGGGPQITLMINAGKKDNVRAGDILGAITGEAKVGGRDVGEITIHNKYSLVNVPAKLADKIVKGVKGCQIKGKRVSIEPIEF